MRVIPKKSLGQNFLVNPGIQRKIVGYLSLKPSDCVLEIGAGRGEFTKLIASKVRKLYALEIDKRLYPDLVESFKNSKGVKITREDIRRYNPASFARLCGKGKKLKVFGNIPYYISTPILERLIKFKGLIGDIFITVQKEFARRVVASPGTKEYGSLSCFIQFHMLPKILLQIKRGCFYPIPNVDSCLLHLKPRELPPVTVKDESVFFKIIRTSFNQRRKTLKNSLKRLVSLDHLNAFLAENELNVNIRAEELSLAQFAILANKIS